MTSKSDPAEELIEIAAQIEELIAKKGVVIEQLAKWEVELAKISEEMAELRSKRDSVYFWHRNNKGR